MSLLGTFANEFICKQRTSGIHNTDYCRLDANMGTGSHTRRPRLLLVDDDRLILGSFTAILEGENFEVEAVCSAAEAAIALQAGAFDVVITDMNMETPTAGHDVIRAARQQPYRPSIVIVTAMPLLTAEWRREGVEAVFLKGAQTPSVLLAGIRNIIEKSTAQGGVRRAV